MGLHPLIDLSNERDVKQAKGFRQAAEALTGASLAEKYQKELESAPRRNEVSKPYLGVQSGRIPDARKTGKDEEHLSAALVDWCQRTGHKLMLPRDAGSLALLDSQVPLATAAPDRAKGDADPNKGVGRIDLLGVGPDDVLAVVKLRFLATDATRGGTGDTPLRAFLEGLATTAMAEANRSAIQAELDARDGPKLSDDPPALILMASPRYWQLCRKREAQKGAAWIKQLERLSREIGETIGLQIFFVGLELEGKPGWDYAESGPQLTSAPHLEPAWERNAGRVRPKAAPKLKGASADDIVVEGDMTRPVRPYSLTESYESGDRIEHPTLGRGVVQRGAGAGKILVRFDEKLSKLVHERPTAGA